MFLAEQNNNCQNEDKDAKKTSQDSNREKSAFSVNSDFVVVSNNVIPELLHETAIDTDGSNEIEDPTYQPAESEFSSVSDNEIVEEEGNDTEEKENENRNTNIDETVQQNVKKTRKRKSNPKTWKVNVTQQKRLRGEEYVGYKNKVKTAKVMDQPCSCRKQCFNKINENDRYEIFQTFWKKTSSWEQRRQFLAQSIAYSSIERQRSRNGTQLGRRCFNYSYFLNVDGKNIDICKTMFLRTLSISEKIVHGSIKYTQDSPGGLIPTNNELQSARKLNEEKRNIVMEHINLFPPIESHYTRARSSKKYLNPVLNIETMYKLYLKWCNDKELSKDKLVKCSMYRFIFCTEFNFSFKKPNLDTCDTCDKFESSLRNITDATQKETIEKEKKNHLDEAENRYALKRIDKERGKQEHSSERVVMIDLQKCLPTPLLTNAKSFYLRQLWTFNLTIHDNTTLENHCMIWDETISGRGANQVASCLMKWISNLPNDVTEITIWSDNCAGQNRNTMLFCMYLYAVKKIPHIQVINHKFLLTGHTHMKVDAVHATIEKKKKKLSTMSIQTPREWAQFIRTCQTKNKPFLVYEMSQEDFTNWANLYAAKGDFIVRKINTDGEPFLSSNAVHLQARKDRPGFLLYKTSFRQDEFKEINFLRNKRKDLHLSAKLVPLRVNSLIPIKKEKYDNIMTLLQWVDKENHQYYQNLPYTNAKDNNDGEDPE